MIDVFPHSYAEMTKDEIETSLFSTITDSLREKYGLSPDSDIEMRVHQEWHRLEEMNSTLDVAALFEFTKWMRENEYAYWAPLGGGSLIFYLLGIANANPLPAHYWCPRCKKVVWKTEYKDGFDLPRSGILCSDCGEKMMRDGHDAPWQMYFGYKDYFAAELRIASSLAEILPNYFDSHWLLKFRSDISLSQPYPNYRELYKFGDLTFITSIDESEVDASFHKNFVDPSKQDQAVANWEALIGAPADMLEGITAPEDFSDLIALSGLMHSTSAWDEDAAYMVSRLGYSYSDLICHRDDVYFYLLAHGFTEKDAWRGAEAARKNKKLPVITGEMRNARDKWVLTRLEKIQYLFRKATTLEYIFFILKKDIITDEFMIDKEG